MSTAANYILPMALFMVFASPETFKAVRGVAGDWVASSYGVATLGGLFLHALIFVTVVGYLMRRRVSGFTMPYDFGKGHETHQGDLGGGLSHANMGSPLN
jgi:hypothetical protein